jgi:histidinol-phosphate aminotransferase
MSLIRTSIQSLHPYVPGEQPGPGVIKLNTNENPYPPSPRVAEALQSADPSSLRLYPDPVSSGLRRQVAALHGCAPEQVFIGNGSDEVLALCVRAFVPEGGAVGYFDPSYSLYPVLAAIEDVPVRPVPLPDEFDWVTPAPDHAALFFLTNPNAPTSRLFARPAVESFCRSFRGVVLLDEAYVDFAPATCADLALSLPNVLIARTLSKSYSLAGLRLGYAVGSAPLIEALHKIKDSYNISLLTQRLAAAALDDPAWMRANVAKIITTRERVAPNPARARLVRLRFVCQFPVCPAPGTARAGDLRGIANAPDLRALLPGPRHAGLSAYHGGHGWGDGRPAGRVGLSLRRRSPRRRTAASTGWRYPRSRGWFRCRPGRKWWCRRAFPE